MWRALARAMTLSNATVPQFIVERSVDWTLLQALRAESAVTLAAGSRRLSVNIPAAGDCSGARRVSSHERDIFR
jgi:hypothetical protein